MVYRAIGLMSGSSLDGLDIAFVEFTENAGSWEYQILHAACYPYESEWKERLRNAARLSAFEYQQLHADYGHYLGKKVSDFIGEHDLNFRVALIASHGHTTFHTPGTMMTAQLGDGAAIAAETGLPVVTDLRAVDVALGGQGAPIVPIGERMLLGDYRYFLNLGGIANISAASDPYVAFDVSPANRVLNLLAAATGREFDPDGALAREGLVNHELLERLNGLDYYVRKYPKSLANEFGTDVVYPMILESGCTTNDCLRTYVEHIAAQLRRSVSSLQPLFPEQKARMLATGGGALNSFLVERIRDQLADLRVELVVPGVSLVNYKEAMVMAFIGVLRWRQENNVLSSVTGAARDSVGGAVWSSR